MYPVRYPHYERNLEINYPTKSKAQTQYKRLLKGTHSIIESTAIEL